MTSRPGTAFLALALAATALAGCSSKKDTSATSPSPSSPATTPSTTPPTTTAPTSSAPPATGTQHALSALSGNKWSVSTLTLKVGDSVVVKDEDSNAVHNFTVDGVG